MFAASRSGVSPPEPSAPLQCTGCAMRENGARSHSVLWTFRSAPASMSMCMTSIRRLSTTWCSAVHPSGRDTPPPLAGRQVGPGRHSLASGALMSAPLSSSSLTMAADCGCPVGPHAQMSAVLPPAATVARSGFAAPYERSGARNCRARLSFSLRSFTFFSSDSTCDSTPVPAARCSQGVSSLLPPWPRTCAGAPTGSTAVRARSREQRAKCSRLGGARPSPRRCCGAAHGRQRQATQ